MGKPYKHWPHAKVPVIQIVQALNRYKSTTFREMKRNFFSDEALPKKDAGYYGHTAHNRAYGRRSSMRKLPRYPSVCALVIKRLKDGWTPEQIAYRMLYENAPLRVCQETIYKYIYCKEGNKSYGGIDQCIENHAHHGAPVRS